MRTLVCAACSFVIAVESATNVPRHRGVAEADRMLLRGRFVWSTAAIIADALAHAICQLQQAQRHKDRGGAAK
jgi:hypothetical protein